MKRKCTLCGINIKQKGSKTCVWCSDIEFEKIRGNEQIIKECQELKWDYKSKKIKGEV